MTFFQPLTFESKNEINSYLQNDPQEISELTFTNLFVWRHSRPIWTAKVGESLLFLTSDNTEQKSKEIILGSPVGKSPPREIITQLQNIATKAIRVPEKFRQIFIDAGFLLQPDRDNADYVYKVSDLAELAGRKFTKKRNHINQCLKKYTCSYEEITAANISECLEMQDRWCRDRGCYEGTALCDEYQAVRELFLHFDFLQVTGGAIRVNGLIQAFAVAEKLLPKTAVWHFEKALPEIDGLGQLITHWFSKYSLSEFNYVNREQDLGIPGLRQAKESYFPHQMVSKYSSFNSMSRTASAKYKGCFHP